MTTTPDYSELVAQAEKAVSGVKDPELKRIAFQKVLDDLLAAPSPAPRQRPRARPAAGNIPKPGKAKARSKGSLSIVKDLNLAPKGRRAFKSFVEEKKPRSHEEKCAVSVYYLEKVLNLEGIGPDHVYTCYKEVKWPHPSDLRNRLSVTAFRGWLVTSDKSNIKVSTRGENLVEQDLPRKTGKA